MLKQKQKPVWRHCLSSVGKKNNIGGKNWKGENTKKSRKKNKRRNHFALESTPQWQGKGWLEQIHFTIGTNTFDNLNKYILQFEQIHLASRYKSVKNKSRNPFATLLARCKGWKCISSARAYVNRKEDGKLTQIYKVKCKL